MNDPYDAAGRPAYASPDPESMRTGALIVWALYVLGLLSAGVFTLAGLILAYWNRGEATGTIYRSHYDYAISTFWISIVITIVGGVLFFVGVGWIVWGIGGIWYIYRIIRGLWLCYDRRPV